MSWLSSVGSGLLGVSREGSQGSSQLRNNYIDTPPGPGQYRLSGGPRWEYFNILHQLQTLLSSSLQIFGNLETCRQDALPLQSGSEIPQYLAAPDTVMRPCLQTLHVFLLNSLVWISPISISSSRWSYAPLCQQRSRESSVQLKFKRSRSTENQDWYSDLPDEAISRGVRWSRSE